MTAHPPFDAALATLVAAGPQASLYNSAEWLERTVRLVSGFDHPLLVQSEGTWLPLVSRGFGRAEALASWYTLAFRPIPTVGGSLTGLSAAVREFDLLRIELSPVPEWDGSAHQLTQAFRAAGWRVDLVEATGNWVHRVDRDSANYLAARPRRLRSTLRRRSREGVVFCAIYHRLTPDLWADWKAVFAASWKGREGSLPFLHEWMTAASADGTLRLGFARVGNQAVAAQFWIVDGGNATIHKLAYCEDAKHLSPGTLLSAALFRHAIDVDRVQLIDYGLGDDAYKRDWMTERRRLMRLTLTDVTTSAGRAWRLRDHAARLVRPLRSR